MVFELVRISKSYISKTMFYFFIGHISLINWTDWNGEDLIASSQDNEKKYAHKPWELKWNCLPLLKCRGRSWKSDCVSYIKRFNKKHFSKTRKIAQFVFNYS